MIKALEGVKFTFKFEVGNKVDLPTVDETGEITLPTVEGSTLTIEGMKEGVVTAGEHLVTLNIEDVNKVLKDSKVTITKTTIEGTETTEDLTLNESFGRATFKTYNAKYNFETGCKYSFAYELENEVIYTTVTEGEHDNVTLSYTVDDKAYTTGEELEVGKTVKVTAVANEGYTLDKVCFNGEALSLTNGTYDFVTTLDKNEVTAYATKNVEVTISLNQESATLEVGDTLELTATVEGLDTYDLVWNSENTEVATVENGKVTALKAGTTTISVYPNGYEDKIASCLVTVNEVEKVYTIAEAISLEDGTENVLVKGKVMSVAYDGFIIADETAYIYVRTYDNIPVVDSNVSITGTKTTYTKSGAIQIENPSINVLEDEVINVKEFDSKEITEEYLSAENSVLMKSLDYVFANDAICVSTGNYINLKINDSYEEKMISIKTTDELGGNFVVGGHYNIKGYIVGLSGSKYLNVYAESIEKVEIQPESIDLNGVDSYDIEAGSTITLSYVVKPSGASQDVTVEIIDGENLVTVNKTEITAGDVAGTVTLKLVTTGDSPIYSDIITLNIIENTTVSYGEIGFGELAGPIDTASGYSSTALNADTLIEFLKEKANNQEIIDEVNSKLVEPSAVYKPNGDNPGLKMGKSGGNGSFTLALSESVKKVDIKFAVWDDKSNYLSINDNQQTINEAKNSVVTYTFDNVNSNVLNIVSGKRIVVLNIALYK